MPKLKQSIALPIFKSADSPLDLLIPAAAEIGYAGVELWLKDEDFKPTLKLCEANGIKLIAWVGHEHDDIAWGIDRPEYHDRIVEELGRHLDLAADLGVRGLTCLTGSDLSVHGSGEAAVEAAIGHCVTCLSRLAEHAERVGVNLNIEPLNDRVDHPDYVGHTTAFGAAVVRGVGSPRVRMLYDIYHMAVQGGHTTDSVIAEILAHQDLIAHYHAAGLPGRGNLDDEQTLDYGKIARAIVDTGYDGFLGHEFEPRGDVVAAMRQAFDACRV